MTQPIIFQRLEGAVILGLSIWLFYAADGHWWMFVIGFFVVDISAFGYVAGNRIGALVYNFGHSLLIPGLIALAGPLLGFALPAWLAIWFGHIGIDRLLGYGLKFSDSFGHTHLGAIGKLARGK